MPAGGGHFSATGGHRTRPLALVVCTLSSFLDLQRGAQGRLGEGCPPAGGIFRPRVGTVPAPRLWLSAL